MTIGKVIRRLFTGVALAVSSTQIAADKLPIPPSTPVHREITGIASHYGTQKDRFGYVDKTDPRVQLLLQKNGINPSTLPVRFVAAEALTPEQMKSLFTFDRNKYRLLTANGSPYNPNKFVVAMNRQYLGKTVKITNTANNRSIIVSVVDTGKFEEKYGRIADLSTAAAEKLGYTSKGTATVTIEILE